MGIILGIGRFLSTLIILIFGALFVLLFSLIPLKHKNISYAAWTTTMMARAFNKTHNIEVIVPHRDRLMNHEGFVFPNHIGFIDITTLISILPMRHLANHAVAKYPIIGQIAKAVDTIFVNRDEKSSRAATREALAAVSKYPAVIVYPEGTTAPTKQLLPFRYGAFQVAIDADMPYIPCVINYSDIERLRWKDEPMLPAYWRVVTNTKKVTAEVVALHAVHPAEGDTGKSLALETYGAMSAIHNGSDSVSDLDF